MALVVTGQIRHRKLQPAEVEALLKVVMPGLATSSPEFSVAMRHCQVDLFCNNTATLDFSVTLSKTMTPAPAAVAVLIREAEVLTQVLLNALSKLARKARVEFCVLEDDKSRSTLLAWKDVNVLWTRGARLSYLICIGLLCLAGYLVCGLLEQPPSDSRDYNVVSLALAIILPAIAVPLPFILEHVSSRGDGEWHFPRSGEKAT